MRKKYKVSLFFLFFPFGFLFSLPGLFLLFSFAPSNVHLFLFPSPIANLRANLLKATYSCWWHAVQAGGMGVAVWVVTCCAGWVGEAWVVQGLGWLQAWQGKHARRLGWLQAWQVRWALACYRRCGQQVGARRVVGKPGWQ